MWIFGQATAEEIDEMKEMGFDVEEVEKTSFNKALDPHYDPETDPDFNEPDGDELVAVFIDCDIGQQLREWHIPEGY